MNIYTYIYIYYMNIYIFNYRHEKISYPILVFDLKIINLEISIVIDLRIYITSSSYRSERSFHLRPSLRIRFDGRQYPDMIAFIFRLNFLYRNLRSWTLKYYLENILCQNIRNNSTPHFIRKNIYISRYSRELEIAETKYNIDFLRFLIEIYRDRNPYYSKINIEWYPQYILIF